MYDKASPEPLDVIASNECGHMTLTAYRFRACFNEIEQLRAALKGAKIALVRDGNVTAAAEILMRADEQRETT